MPLVLLVAYPVDAATYDHDANVAEECRVRDGLPNVSASPRTDICFVYTISASMLKGMRAGKPSGFGRIMETIANAYGIPSIDLGVEVAAREKAGCQEAA